MKTSKKLKIVAACMTIIGVLLIVLSITIFKTCVNCGQGWEGHKSSFGEKYTPNFALLSIGAFLTTFSFPVWLISFGPQMTKMGARLQSETMDVAGEDIQEAASKTIDVAEPIMSKATDAVEPHVKKVVKTTAGAVKEGLKGDPREELEKAQNLYDEGLISEEEYEALRKKILGL